MSEDRVQKHPGGRPPKFKPEFVEQAQKLTRLGATMPEVADFFGVNRYTVNYWARTNPEFFKALRVGGAEANERVVQSMYMQAVGYDYTEEQAIKVKVGQYEEKVEVVEVQRHCPSSFPAGKFWLVNKDKKNWTDVSRHELTGADGKDLGARRYKDLTDEELDDLQQKMAKVKRIDAPKKGE